MHAGVVQAGVQFTLFFALLYYLLAAEADPLLYAVRLLPLSDSGRQQAATALSDALRGVFLCALKVLFCYYTSRPSQHHCRKPIYGLVFSNVGSFQSWDHDCGSLACNGGRGHC